MVRRCQLRSFVSRLNPIVYETSLRVSVLFSSTVGIASTLAYLLPTYYTSQSSTHFRDSTILITLLSQLDSSYPSQRDYYRHHQEFLSSGCVARGSPTVSWLTSVAGAVRSCNYYKVEALTRPRVYMPLLESRREKTNENSINLDSLTVRTILSSLHNRLRGCSWRILRVAYREMTCLPKVTDTSEWLTRCLTLDSNTTVDSWFKKQLEEGNVKAKEMEGKWSILKPTPS